MNKRNKTLGITVQVLKPWIVKHKGSAILAFLFLNKVQFSVFKVLKGISLFKDKAMSEWDLKFRNTNVFPLS